VPWQRTPTIAVLATDDSDPRYSLVDEAVAFWNKTLQELGSGLCLGPIVRRAMPIPEEGLRALSESIAGVSARLEAERARIG